MIILNLRPAKSDPDPNPLTLALTGGVAGAHPGANYLPNGAIS